MPSQDRIEKLADAPIGRIPNDTFHLLCQFWQLSDADHPAGKDVSYTGEDSILFLPGIVFMTDSSLLENPLGEMQYGRFKLDGKNIHVVFDNGNKARYQIGRLNKNELKLKRSEDKHTSDLDYNATNTYWANAAKNPFSRENYNWTVKPNKPETEGEIKKRTKDCIRFYAYYLQGYVDGGATKIDFRGMPCCFHWYSGGISIQNENKLDPKWISCFYSKQQAFTGRQMIEDIISKKYKWNEKETDWIKQSVPVLLQMRDSL
jgi:hypothetical protein